MTAPRRTQVAIVGAGPAGLLLCHLLHADPSGDPFEERLALSHLEHIAGSASAATTIADNYTGLPLDR